MTRKKLWSLTALACALLTVPSLPELRMPRVNAGLISPPAVVAAVVALLVLSLAIVVSRLRRTPADRVTALARRGRPLAAIARRTRLPQDAVRDLLGGEPMAVSTAWTGTFFRRRPKPAAKAPASFAAELKEKSFDATL